jgi:hypothetical protein
MPLLKPNTCTLRPRDTGAPPPAAPNSEVFAADAQVLPSTANAKDGTIDVVWYSGAMCRGSTAPPASPTCSSSTWRAAASTG